MMPLHHTCPDEPPSTSSKEVVQTVAASCCKRMPIPLHHNPPPRCPCLHSRWSPTTTHSTVKKIDWRDKGKANFTQEGPERDGEKETFKNGAQRVNESRHQSRHIKQTQRLEVLPSQGQRIHISQHNGPCSLRSNVRFDPPSLREGQTTSYIYQKWREDKPEEPAKNAPIHQRIAAIWKVRHLARQRRASLQGERKKEREVFIFNAKENHELHRHNTQMRIRNKRLKRALSGTTDLHSNLIRGECLSTFS